MLLLRNCSLALKDALRRMLFDGRLLKFSITVELLNLLELLSDEDDDVGFLLWRSISALDFSS
jgi:hypothetical protein